MGDTIRRFARVVEGGRSAPYENGFRGTLRLQQVRRCLLAQQTRRNRARMQPWLRQAHFTTQLFSTFMFGDFTTTNLTHL